MDGFRILLSIKRKEDLTSISLTESYEKLKVNETEQGVILQEDDSSDELEIEREAAIHIQTTEKLPSPWNMDKVTERLKTKKVEVTTRTTKSKKPFKACFKCMMLPLHHLHSSLPSLLPIRIPTRVIGWFLDLENNDP
ncbi:hypothetical protein L1987_07205 [Smallanthus sonchifolius]|uniref:Uncharacterized protein n=1 Tax=Smallanthus sonchifolius TaxID=185202 RepID=A0ACB9K0G3_9ASTR|nr:hypothetical protein L1987_07205 [Smallanthus sonchifolius]